MLLIIYPEFYLHYCVRLRCFCFAMKSMTSCLRAQDVVDRWLGFQFWFNVFISKFIGSGLLVAGVLLLDLKVGNSLCGMASPLILKWYYRYYNLNSSFMLLILLMLSIIGDVMHKNNFNYRLMSKQSDQWYGVIMKTGWSLGMMVEP